MIDAHDAPPSADENAKTASWQSIWWALIAIILNTYLQAPTRILSLGPRYRLLSLFLPGLRFLDAVEIWFKIIRAALNGSLSISPPKILGDRLRGCTVPPAPTGGEARWLRPVAFGLGALPQYIKIFSIRGIPVTQAWAGMYLFSFLTLELLLWVGDSGEYLDLEAASVSYEVKEKQPSPPGRLEDARGNLKSTWYWMKDLFADIETTITTVCVLIHIGISIWAQAHLLWKSGRTPGNKGDDSDGLFIFLLFFVAWPMMIFTPTLTAILMIEIGHILHKYIKPHKILLIPIYLASAAFFAFTFFEAIFYIIVLMYQEKLHSAIAYSLVYHAEIFAVMSVSVTFSYNTLRFHSIVLLISFFSNALLYYSNTYDRTTTYKANWIENLG